MLAKTRTHAANNDQGDSGSPARKKARLSSEGERDGRPQRPRSSNGSQSSPGAKARRRKVIEMAIRVGSEEKGQEDLCGIASSLKDSPEEVIPSSQEEPEKLDNADSDGPETIAPPTIPPALDISKDDADEVPDKDTEVHIAEWFQPAASQASFVPASEIYSGTASRVGNEWTVPSQQALEVASQRLAEWQQEDPVEASPSVGRKVLGSVENVPSSSRPPIAAAKFHSPVLRTQPPSSGRQNTPASPAFVPPAIRSRINSVGSAAYQGSPLNPHHSSASQFSSSSQVRPASAFGFATPAKPTSTGLSSTPRSSRPARAVFATPFKAGVKPGIAGRTPADMMQQKLKEQASLAAEKERKVEEKRRKERETAVFDLTSPPGRHSMDWHGIMPKSYTAEELYRQGIPTEIPSINLRNAQYYRFNAPTFSQVASGSTALRPLGTNDALASLREKGCSLATPAWVDNHWAMILWKLASLICACPDLLRDKWTYHEVVNQLLYRYERELNRVQRPAFRLITEGDTPSTRPMTICVSAIVPGETGVTEEGEPVEGLPLLDVTDGWYRLRATVDEPLARAIKRGILKAGTKISVSGAKLQGGKDGIEPLEAYNKGVHLQLHGNSTTLARWDAKLGFRNSPLPFIATLRSLTPDGGPVMLMDIVVTKSFPVGYIEFLKEEEEGVRPETRCELEERQEESAWKNRRSNEEIKLRDAFEKKMGRLEGIAERLEGMAKGFRPPADDYPPDHVEDIYDQLEESQDSNSLIKGLSPQESGWLASVIRSKSTAARERVAESIRKDLNDVCPPRDVRNFCVIRFRDNRVSKHQPMREGQLTVWDVLSLGKDALAEGKRFFVTNVAPSSPSMWSHHDAEGEACFVTKRDTRWTALPSSA